jgi:hypothetical protein
MSNRPAINDTVSNYGMDPYFYQYYMQNYADSIKAAQAQQTENNSATSQITATTESANTAFRASVDNAKKSKSSLLPALITITVGTIGAGCYIASRGSAKGILEQLKARFRSFGSSSKTKQGIFTFAQTKNGKKVCTIPGKVNKIHQGDTAKQLEMVGLDNGTNLNLSELTTTIKGETKLAEGVQIRKCTYKVGKNTVTVKNGKIVSYKDEHGKDILIRYNEPGRIAKYKTENEAAKKEIDEFIANLYKGKLDKAENLEVVINQDGILRKFVRTNPSDNFNFDYALTNRFSIDDKAVDSYRLRNSEVDSILKNFKDGEKHTGKTLMAEYKTVAEKGGEEYTFIINNGKIEGIKNASGKKLSQTEIDSLQYHYPKIFENALKDTENYVNPVYTV